VDCRKEFDQIYRQKILPDDPTVSISITNKTDMAHAPIGQENWLVMVNVPPVGTKIDWLSQAENYKNTILQKITSFGFDLTIRSYLRRS
jgi:phytoene desaturase